MDKLIELIDVDDLDKSILTLFQKDPEITHSEIADKVGLSQPAVGARIKRLKESGILEHNYGINLRNIKSKIVRIDISSGDSISLLEEVKSKQNVIFAYRMIGNINLTIWVVAETWDEVEEFTKNYIRNIDNTRIVNMNVISAFGKGSIATMG
ncbi:MAG: winged helix-turn-helix transcriptional regulator [Candidatus Lokiarchaeota archaeon]|nr:winged helix-turn-helix transcriptional regulator [Candidatus Lokiarchaeota archaeon]